MAVNDEQNLKSCSVKKLLSIFLDGCRTDLKKTFELSVNDPKTAALGRILLPGCREKFNRIHIGVNGCKLCRKSPPFLVTLKGSM